MGSESRLAMSVNPESRDNTYTKNEFVVVLVGLNELTILVNNVDIRGVVQAEVRCHNFLCTQFNLTTELVDTLPKLKRH